MKAAATSFFRKNAAAGRSQVRRVLRSVEAYRPEVRTESWDRPIGPGRGMTVTASSAHPAAATSPPRRIPPTGIGGAGTRIAVRCLLTTTSLDAGGMDEFVAFLARRLPEYGISTAVLHLGPVAGPTSRPVPSRLAGELRREGIPVWDADEASTGSEVTRWAPDLVNAHGGYPDWLSELAVDRLTIPFVHTLHGLHDFFAVDWEAEAARSENVSTIIAVSESVRSYYLAGNSTFPPGRALTIPNGVDDSRLICGDRAAARTGLGLGDEYLFVSLGRYCLQKNAYALVRAFDAVARWHADAHLLIAGRVDDPRYFRRIHTLRKGSPFADRIHLRDHSPNPARLLDAADGFVLNSFFEGWSLASMEALCAGVPVVISDVGGAHEQVGTDRDCGYVVSNPLDEPNKMSWRRMGAARYASQRNETELQDAMRALVQERHRYQANRTTLAARSAARFSATTCLRRHADALTAAVAGPGRQPIRLSAGPPGSSAPLPDEGR